MRERRLIQRRRREPRRRRPGFFRVERPGQLWHLDMTSVWVAEHGWCYLMAAIDCCTREIVGWQLELRCRAKESVALIERAAAERRVPPGTLTLGTDNGSAFTACCLDWAGDVRPRGEAVTGGELTRFHAVGRGA